MGSRQRCHCCQDVFTARLPITELLDALAVVGRGCEHVPGCRAGRKEGDSIEGNRRTSTMCGNTFYSNSSPTNGESIQFLN